MAWPEPIERALGTTPGAVFRRCALQVNPFGYLRQHGKQSSFTDEQTYNAAIVEACNRAGITVVGITDHHRASTMRGLREALTAADITVFPGFETRSKDGVHALVLFEPSTEEDELVGWLGKLGVTTSTNPNETADLDFRELLDLDWNAAIVAGQLNTRCGLLKVLTGDCRRKAWLHPRLLAGAIPCPVDKIEPEGIRRIIQGKDPQYRRPHPIALVYANDIADTADIEKVNTSCWLKMTEPTVSGLKAAFRDPESRVRRPAADDHAHSELVAAAWTGGFLDGTAFRFSDNLNVLIGGRGTGKSTLIESLRYALDLNPRGAAARTHKQIVDEVLGPGGTVRVLVWSPSPSPASYLVERRTGEPPVVRDEAGNDTGLSPRQVIPKATLWGQHEIVELEQPESKRVELIERFAGLDLSLPTRKAAALKALSRNREQLATVEDRRASAQDQLAELPALEEQQRRYRTAGVEEQLREQSQLVREENLLDIASRRLASLREALVPLADAARPDRAFAAPSAVEGLPNADLIAAADAVLERLETRASRLGDELSAALSDASAELASMRTQWSARRERRREEFDRRLREVATEHVDGAGFLQVRRALEEMVPVRERADRLEHEHRLLLEERDSLLAEWTTLRIEEAEGIADAARFANEHLRNQVRVTTVANGDTGPLEALLGRIGGRLDLVKKAVKNGVDPIQLATWCRDGRETLMQQLAISENQADRLCSAGHSIIREIEELDLRPRANIELNIGRMKAAQWQPYDSLSKGQKATAALLLLLLGGNNPGPLVIDQPEDDLDNAFIFQTIVPAMRREKLQRQFLFASHDPNIPVLGDAELIVQLHTEFVGKRIVGRIGALGSIDLGEVRAAVEENLEGGREAFERRRRMYGF